MDGNILTGKAPEKETRQNGNTAFRNMPAPNKPAARLPATDNHHTITNTLMTNTKLFCCVPALILLLSLTAIGCRKNPVAPVTEPKISITVEDVSCTEAWIRVKTEGVEKLQNTQFLVNDKPLPNFVLLNSDTLVYVESLKVKQQYTFTVTGSYRNEYDKEKPVNSAKQTATTMDTTSHDFVWQTWTFGIGASSEINDITIINENDIWAVGTIHTDKTDRYDSLGNWQDPYNALHWNGTQWELKTLYYIENGIRSWAGINAIYAFSESDIWFGVGRLIHWNGKDFVSVKPTEGSFTDIIIQIWGSSGSDFYIVGQNGSIAHYNGNKWEKIESGTELTICSIWGEKKQDRSGYEILCVAEDVALETDRKILSIEGNKVTEKGTEGLPRSINSVWFKPGRKYIVVGDGMYSSIRLGKKWQKCSWLLGNDYKIFIRGEDYSDIFVSGSFGLLLHYNGSTWKNYQNDMGRFFGVYGNISKKGNIVATCGYKGDQGITCIGKRQC